MRLASSLSLAVEMISSYDSWIESSSLRAGVRWSVSIFLVAFQTELAACLNHMLYYKAYKSRSYLPRRLNHVGGHQSKNNHHEIDQVLHNRRSVFSAAQSREDEEDGDPDDEFAAHEHACRAADQREETSTIGFLLHYQLRRIIVHYVFGVDSAHYQQFITSTPITAVSFINSI